MTNIEWTDETWNPVTGCTKVSSGCAHCYAETVADRFWATQYPPVYPGGDPDRERPRAFTDVWCHPDRLQQPLCWRKPRRVFVNSMSDLFHEAVPDAFIDEVFSVMTAAERHTFQVLTKRSRRMREFCIRRPWAAQKNVWLGVSCENQAMADERISMLLQTPAVVRFVSAEPLLGPIEFTSSWLSDDCLDHDHRSLDWVIVGGESGSRARICDVEWIRSILGQCRMAGVPCFVKQLGSAPGVSSRLPSSHPDVKALEFGLRSRKGANPDEWPEDLRVREFPTILERLRL